MRLYVPLTVNEAARLAESAQRDRRRPQDQAAYLIVRALEFDRSETTEPVERKVREPAR